MLEREIQEQLTTKTFGRRIFSFESIDSTNTFAKSIAQDAGEGTLVIAEEQTHGRGRLGRSWHSGKSKNLTFSVIITPDIAPEYLGVLSLYAGLCVAEAIEERTQLVPECKWPNDIMMSGKKCCGILSESTLVKGKAVPVILGIGINVNENDFPPELRTVATSLFLEAKRMIDRVDLLAAILKTLEDWYRLIRENDYARIIHGWQLRAPMMGRAIAVQQNGNIMNGIAQRLNTDGSLVLCSGDMEMNLMAGDVSIIDGYRS